MYTDRRGPAHNDTDFFTRLMYLAFFSFSHDRVIIIQFTKRSGVWAQNTSQPFVYDDRKFRHNFQI